MNQSLLRDLSDIEARIRAAAASTTEFSPLSAATSFSHRSASAFSPCLR